MSDQPLIQVEAAPTFNRNLRILAKKYRSIRSDIQPVIEQLERGELPGDQISGIGYEVFKLRIRSSDIQKGKSGGYRLIYYVKTFKQIIISCFLLSLFICFLVCLYILLFSPDKDKVNFASDAIKTLTGFFIGAITGYLG